MHDLGLSSNRGTLLAWRCTRPHVVLSREVRMEECVLSRVAPIPAIPQCHWNPFTGED